VSYRLTTRRRSLRDINSAGVPLIDVNDSTGAAAAASTMQNAFFGVANPFSPGYPYSGGYLVTWANPMSTSQIEYGAQQVSQSVAQAGGSQADQDAAAQEYMNFANTNVPAIDTSSGPLGIPLAMWLAGGGLVLGLLLVASR
jgi:hypothetical protein